MRLAIIGAGFYGTFLSYKIKKKFPKFKIYLIEKEGKILTKSSINNQYRLHQGFHYPRSINTINQTKFGYQKFCNEFKKFLFFPKNNIYLIHKNSTVNFKKYVSVFKKNKINFKIIKPEIFKKYLTNPKDYEGGVKVKEGVIKLEKLYFFLKNFIKKSKNINLKLNHEVTKIDKKNGNIYFKNKQFLKNFDLIINTSYIDLNISLSKKFKVKFELASIIKIHNNYYSNSKK